MIAVGGKNHVKTELLSRNNTWSVESNFPNGTEYSVFITDNTYKNKEYPIEAKSLYHYSIVALESRVED